MSTSTTISWPFHAESGDESARETWQMISAAGFAAPVPGHVYDGTRLDGGVPLGGLGTGYFTLEGDGKIGHCSIFNDIVPPRKDCADWLTLRCVGPAGPSQLPLSTARIDYFGHYPMADLVAHFDEQPLTLGLRAFSPFIPGDAAASNIPAALFEIELRNHADQDVTVDVLLAFSEPTASKAATQPTTALRADNLSELPTGGRARHSISLNVPAGGACRARFVFAWYAPNWRDSGGEAHVHRYGPRYASAQAVADEVWARFDELLRRVLAWQREIYQADLPMWLRDGLVQGLYSLAKNTVWIARTRNDEWWPEQGWFTHNESHTGCPITETMVCRMHGHFPALFFFPELEASTLEAFKHFQISDGEVPFSYGMTTSMRDPRYHCQHPLNSGQYAQMIYRLYRRTGDLEQLRHFYESAKRAIRYQYSLDDDGDGLVNDQAHVAPGEFWPANQFYDIWPWWGTSAYVAGTWLATLAAGRALAEAMQDADFAAECAAWLERAQRSYERKLWTGEYYRLWNDDVNDRRSDISLGNQLMAQWCAKVAGLPNLLPEANVQSALAVVQRLNLAATRYGLVNGATPDGQRFDAGANFSGDNDHGKHVFVGENWCAAMTFIYHGQAELGLDIARRIYEAVALKTRSPWNQRCIISAESGLPIWGDDYYSNLAVWALPMALQNADVAAFVQPGSLVDRLIQAGNQET